ncbi:uncharacterized protein LOC129179159 [Dunckerocampus dactyliophorus]|uniref:uncharacterized protein LOC129179159 n=1 Tax=Dunckerocampus dactyliophorus TaxID=161453 RepID=UPI0024066B51|nr:uncharacterized protein LOC129179159 [Dunckerocampus dactyliophorus]
MATPSLTPASSSINDTPSPSLFFFFLASSVAGAERHHTFRSVGAYGAKAGTNSPAQGSERLQQERSMVCEGPRPLPKTFQMAINGPREISKLLHVGSSSGLTPIPREPLHSPPNIWRECWKVKVSSGENRRHGGSCDTELLLLSEPERRSQDGNPRGGEDEFPNRTDTTLTTLANGLSTTTTERCICGKVCKNERGLKIHQGRMKCLAQESATQRTGPSPGETTEEPGRETPHRAQNLQVPSSPAPSIVVQQPRIKWPPANQHKVWHQFDEDITRVIESTAKGDVDRRLQTITTIIVTYGTERFGVEERKSTRPNYTMNRRAEKIHQLRQELRSLARQYKAASEEEKPPLAELRNIIRRKLTTLRRAEWHRRRRRERARKRTAFIADPFGFIKQLLGQKRSGHLACSKEEVDYFLKNNLSDPEREQDLGPLSALLDIPSPTVDFNTGEPTWKEIQDVVAAARSRSAPGPSGVPYKVYKRCPGLLRILWKTLRVIWRRGAVADQWRLAEGVWIPKEENSTKLEQFRTISLLSVEGKIFFSILSRRLTDFLLKNAYIDTAVQKGGIPGVSGCLEHTGVVTQLIREAREGKGDLVVLWLDLASAFGSIPHKLVETTLDRHHVPRKIKDLILNYYGNFRLRVTSGSTTSDWHRLEKGIITGCTISVSLFALAMNMVVKAAERECRGPLSKSGIRQPPIRAFMDDLTVTTTSVPGGRWILQGLEKLISWARMSFKPIKSRAMVLKKGKVVDKFRFFVDGTAIPSITEKPVKSLGKIFDCSLRDSASIQITIKELETWLSAVDKSGLPGRFKAWIYQHGVLPRVLWPLLVYEVPLSTVETLERRISTYLRRWMGFPRSLCSVALYGRTNKLQLPFSSLDEEFRVSRTSEALLYRDSKDSKVASAGIVVRTGRKWRAQDGLVVAESRLRHRALVGTVAMGRSGLGAIPQPCYEKAHGKDKRELVLKEVRAGVEEERTSRMVGMQQQGAWTKWEGVLERKVTWSEIWKAEPQRIGFMVRAVYDVLPSPANLHLWGMSDSPACALCSRKGSLEHILSSCSKALGEGRYRWRHDQVLKTVAESISKAVAKNISHKQQLGKRNIAFVRAGEQPLPQPKPAGYLTSAVDWDLRVDLDKQLKFPDHITATSLRPDIVLASVSSRQVLLLELTVPWEDCIEEANERKRSKYQELVEQCLRAGWKARCEPIEVGCRGFAGRSLCKVFTLLGITGAAKWKAIKSTMEAAERASRWLWIRRSDLWAHATGTQAGE